jgi:hypothetical protein
LGVDQPKACPTHLVKRVMRALDLDANDVKEQLDQQLLDDYIWPCSQWPVGTACGTGIWPGPKHGPARCQRARAGPAQGTRPCLGRHPGPWHGPVNRPARPPARCPNCFFLPAQPTNCGAPPHI